MALIDGLDDVGAAVALARHGRGSAVARAVPPAELAAADPAVPRVGRPGHDAGAGERAQMLLSALWAVVGVAALIAGLVRDRRALRTGALVLVGTALAKVFLYDLAKLTAMARVASFVALGLLLLGAFAWQRIRPRPLPDLREAPPGARLTPR